MMAKGRRKQLVNKRMRAALNPCGLCSGDCFVESILCDACETWYHYSCQSLDSDHITMIKDLPRAFLCTHCRSSPGGGYDFNNALLRLNVASKNNYREFENSAILEEIMMLSHQTPLPDVPLEPININLPGFGVDEQSHNILSQNGGLRGYLPVQIEGDGDALFRSVSLGMYGEDTLTQELRVRCCIEMVNNRTFYTSVHRDDDLSSISPEYQQSCRDCATPQGASSAWTLHAMASVVQSPVMSVYPTVNGLLDKCVSILNNKFTPRQCQSDKFESHVVLSILWTRFGDEECPEGSWVPNHFVPLVAESAEQAELNCSHQHVEILTSQGSLSAIEISAQEGISGNETINQDHDEEMDVTLKEFPELQQSDSETSPSKLPIPLNVIKVEMEEALLPSRKKSRRTLPPAPHYEKKPDAAPDSTPLENGFLLCDQVLKVLNTPEPGIKYIPRGLKEDVYFVIDNRDNILRRQNGHRSVFSDDCGSYDTKSSSTKTTIFHYVDGKMTYLIKQNGLYGRTVKKVFEPLSPQPEGDEIVIMKRSYGCLKRKLSYRKRVTWFECLPLEKYLPEALEKAVVEYTGQYPEEISIHGNSKKLAREYSQSPLNGNKETEEIVASFKPKEAFRRLMAKGMPPRDLRQIQNKRYNLKKKAKKEIDHVLEGEVEVSEMIEAPDILQEHAQTMIVNLPHKSVSEALDNPETHQLVLESVENEGEAATYYIIHTEGTLEQVEQVVKGTKSAPRPQNEDSDDAAGSEPDVDSDSYYHDDVDKFHMNKNKILLDSGAKLPYAADSSGEDEVLAFDDDDDDDDDDEGLEEMKLRLQKLRQHGHREELSSDLEDDDDQSKKRPEKSEKSWGLTKNKFYGGHDSDLEYDNSGSEPEADALEEQEALAIQKRLLQAMDEDDIGLEMFKVSDKVEDKPSEKITQDLSKLSKKEKMNLLKKQSPELLDLIADFKTRSQELQERLMPIMKLIREQRLPAQSSGARLVQTKTKLYMNYLVNLSFYLMLKAKQSPVENHPVIKRLVQYRNLMKQLDAVEPLCKADMDSILQKLAKGKVFKVMEDREAKTTFKSVILQKKKTKALSKTSKDRRSLSELAGGLDSDEEDYDALADDELEQEALSKKRFKSNEEDDLDDDAEDDLNLGNDEEMDEGEGEGDTERRGINYQIEKNKGLTVKKRKELRNPRVKHRMKYRKAKIRRKGQVREPRTEMQRYGGEMSGIRAGIKRSIKLQ